MIVRVIGQGQYEVGDPLLGQLNELDRKALDALERNDEHTLDECLDAMSVLVQEQGRRLPDDELSASDIVIPPSDLTLDETRKLVSEQGFFPAPTAAKV